MPATSRALLVGVASVLLSAALAAHAETAQEQRAKQEATIPKCAKKYGTLAVVEPETNWWTEVGLGSPVALIKVYVNQSGCFTLLDPVSYTHLTLPTNREV